VRSAILRGREHARLGAIDVVAEGPAAIAISLGGAPKAYAHTDPNEDVALFALGEGGVLAAVADGHAGFDASEVALERLLECFAPTWTSAEPLDPDAWSEAALRTFADVEAAIEAATADGPKADARTTLAFAVARPAQDLLFYASIGDSHVFRVRAELADDLGTAARPRDPSVFLGRERKSLGELGISAAASVAKLGGVRCIALVTDGLSERHVGVADPEEVVRQAVERAALADAELRALAAARATAQAALDAHTRNPSGDNVAVSTIWIG
jgi:serine/threonine protein phosphatase PrpC